MHISNTRTPLLLPQIIRLAKSKDDKAPNYMKKLNLAPFVILASTKVKT
jgi:hypothetical protein